MQEELQVEGYKEVMKCRKNKILSFILNLKFACGCCADCTLNMTHSQGQKRFDQNSILKTRNTRVEHYCMNITVHSTCSLQQRKISNKLHKVHFLTGSQFGTKCIMVFIQYLSMNLRRSSFLVLHFFTKTEPVTWHQNPQDHNSHEHALENTSVHLACNTYTCQMFSVLEKLMSSLSVTSGQQNKVKMSLWEHVWCKMWNPKLPGVVLSCAGTRAEVQPWITRLTGSDWVELCRTLERTFVKNTVQASSFFTHTH